jgi:HEAT repeat protein
MRDACARIDQDQASLPTEAGIAQRIASGRAALADQTGLRSPDRRQRNHHAIAGLFALLWHPELEVRRSAALALSGGDQRRPYQPQFGHFATAFLRYLTQHSPHGDPATEPARRAAVIAALRNMLEQSSRDIHAMGNMHYSFLSSALYLALLFTCRDAVECARRLCDGALHPEICRLLGSLSHDAVSRRLNARDAEALTASAGQALAAMPADDITEFWRWLTHPIRARRRAVAPTLSYFTDPGAVPHLLHALPQQPPDIVQPLIACLGRMGDQNALPALLPFTRSRRRAVRGEALAAIANIRRSGAAHPASTLLRAAHHTPGEDRLLLRTVDGEADPQPAQLLRPSPQEMTSDEKGAETDA